MTWLKVTSSDSSESSMRRFSRDCSRFNVCLSAVGGLDGNSGGADDCDFNELCSLDGSCCA